MIVDVKPIFRNILSIKSKLTETCVDSNIPCILLIFSVVLTPILHLKTTFLMNLEVCLLWKLNTIRIRIPKYYIMYCIIVLGRCSQTSVLSLAGSLPINDR